MPGEVDYDRIGREYEKATERLLEKYVAPERETKRIQEVVKEEVPKVLDTELKKRMDNLKSSLIQEVKGLSKEDATELVDARVGELIKKECEDPNSPSCVMAKQTAKVVVEEILTKKSEEKKPFEIPKMTPEFEEEWKKLTPEQRKALDLIPAKAHKTMLEIILESPESHKGLNKDVMNRLKEEEIIEIVNERPDLAVVIGKAMCGANEACRTSWNKAIEESTEIKEEEKKSWLLKKQESKE